ncbi:MAG: hypothetical protein QXQ57_06450 [Sulfolobales archaeon]
MVESPVVESTTCYLSTNFIASYVLRDLCGLGSIADKVDALLSRYPRYLFYDYYQILLFRDIPYPFRLISTVDVASKTIGNKSISIKTVVVRDEIFKDYYEYANMLFYDSIRNQLKGSYGGAGESYWRAMNMFDGRGFADRAHASLGYYETYKLALGLYTARMLAMDSDIELFRNLLNSIEPFATLYNPNLQGVGDLNVETASLTAIALYSNLPLIIQQSKPTTQQPYLIDTLIIYGVAAIASILIIYIIHRIRKYLSTTSGYRS